MRRRSAAVAIVALSVVGMAVLHPTIGPQGAAASHRRPVLVAAASSLSVVAEELEEGFEAAHPDHDLVFNFAGSSSLREQVLDGLPADVLVTANTDVLDEVEAAELIIGPVSVVAANRIVLAVPAGAVELSTRSIEAGPSRDELTSSDLLIGVCIAAAPCGSAAEEFFEQLGVEVAPASREPDVRALVTKLEADELDVGLVYASDVAASGGALEVIDWAGAPRVGARYPAAVLANGDNQTGGEALVAYLASDPVQDLFDRLGFGGPHGAGPATIDLEPSQPVAGQQVPGEQRHSEPGISEPRISERGHSQP